MKPSPVLGNVSLASRMGAGATYTAFPVAAVEPFAAMNQGQTETLCCFAQIYLDEQRCVDNQTQSNSLSVRSISLRWMNQKRCSASSSSMSRSSMIIER